MKGCSYIIGLTLAASLLVGCGGAKEPESAEVVLPDEQAVTKPEIESPQPVPPLETGVASTATPSPGTPEPAGTPVETTTTPAASTTPASTPAAAPATTGTEFARFSGRITVDGVAPQLPPLVQAGDPTVKDQVCVQSAIPNDSVIVGPDGGLKDVFIYAKRVPGGVNVPAPPEEPAELDQKGCRFMPQAMVFRVDQPLNMVNSDPVAHNVRTAGFTMQLNQIIPPNDKKGITTTYERAERTPVQTKCDIHTWMLSWHLPLDHPWATVSAEDGTFVIDNLPAGDWEFIIWHGKTGYVERSVKFSAAQGEVIERNFTVPASKLQ
jgi:hypothetical protein